MIEPVVIGFGGNVGTEPEIIERFRGAREAITALGDVKSARLYRSAPLGPPQPAYLNTAVRLRMPDAQPAELIATLLEIEHLLGRVRGERWGPRLIDLDVLVWGDRAIRTPELEVPHPRLHERRFALAPLVDLLGEDFILGGKRAGDLLAAVAAQAIEQISDTW